MALGARAVARWLPSFDSGSYLVLDPASGASVIQSERGYWAGFLAGKLWLLSDHFDDAELRRAATEATRWCTPLMREVDVDVGFMSQYGPAMGFELTGEEWMKRLALAGCESFVQNWNPALGIFMVWPPTAAMPEAVRRIPREIHQWETYIDEASCASVLWWARRFEPRYGELARSHQEAMTRLGLIQPDGRVHHLLGFDPRTRQPIKFHTAQGWSDDSQWTRAQGWGMSSSVFGYEATGDRRFFDAAVRVCDYYLEHMLGGGRVVPFYDVRDPRIPDVPRDTCTAALAANAMVRLMHVEPALESRYGAYVEAAIAELLESHTTADGTLLHGSWGNMWGNAAECVMPYGNLFLTETLYRLLHPDADPWGTRPVSPAAAPRS
jgi:unsaturated chondroitin disaccharide hydrolase